MKRQIESENPVVQALHAKSEKFNRVPGSLKLYYHKTDGGAKYLTDTFILCKGGHKEGTFTDKTKYIVRIDGDIAKDAELDVRNADKELLKVLRRIQIESNFEAEDKSQALGEMLLTINSLASAAIADCKAGVS